VNYREESEEEVESDQSDDDDGYEGDALEEERDSDIEIIEPKEEESDSDIEIVEKPGGSKRQPSLHNPLKRSRALATSDEDEDGANDKPPSPTPQQVPTKNKKSGGASREVENLRSNRSLDVSPSRLSFWSMKES